MSHRCWTRPARYLPAAVMAISVGYLATPVTAQDAFPAPTTEEREEVGVAGEEPTRQPDAPTDPETPAPESSPESPEAASPEPMAPALTEGSPPPDVLAPIEPAPVEPVVAPAPLNPSPQPVPPASSADSAALAQPLQAAPPSGPSPVAPSPTPWSFSLTMGYYHPRLGTLNRILQDTSLTMLQDPNFLLPRNQNFSFEQRNLEVEGIEGGLTYGVDTFYNTGGPHSFGVSFSSWRGETFGQDTISLFLRSNRDPINAPRSARYNLILDQIFLEWRYHLFRNPEGKGLYLNAGLVGISLAFFTMDSLVNVVDPDLSFASVSSDESFGWGYTTRFGVGGDYPLTSWLSIGGRANYVLGNIREMEVTRHFSAGFPNFPPENPLTIRPGVPLPQLFFTPREGRTVSYASVTTTGDLQEEAGDERIVTLELSGWEGLFDFTVRF